MILFLFTAWTSVFSISATDHQPPLISFENNVLEVHINHHHSKAELMDLKKQLLEKYQVKLDFVELDYGRNKKIKKIKIAVDTGIDCIGTAGGRRFLTLKPKVWFAIDYNNDSFHIGAGKHKR